MQELVKTPWLIMLAVMLVMSIITFVVCVYDKIAAKKQRRRIRELTLFLLSILGGSPGMLLGMSAVRHKTRHKSFTLAIPLILVCQCVLFGWLLGRSL